MRIFILLDSRFVAISRHCASFRVTCKMGMGVWIDRASTRTCRCLQGEVAVYIPLGPSYLSVLPRFFIARVRVKMREASTASLLVVAFVSPSPMFNEESNGSARGTEMEFLPRGSFIECFPLEIWPVARVRLFRKYAYIYTHTHIHICLYVHIYIIYIRVVCLYKCKQRSRGRLAGLFSTGVFGCLNRDVAHARDD